jgi:hypothetical protein
MNDTFSIHKKHFKIFKFNLSFDILLIRHLCNYWSDDMLKKKKLNTKETISYSEKVLIMDEIM